MKNKKSILLSLITLGALSACTKEKLDFDYMPDMYKTTALKPQREDPESPNGLSQRVPPEGTIPRGFDPYPYTKEEVDKAGKELSNPFPRTTSNLQRGQKIYQTYCIVCHGPQGDGLGYVVPPYSRPPSLLSEKVRKWPDGSIFHVATRGQNLMPGYASQISSNDRWLIVHYVRVLQRAAQPTEQDLKQLESMKK